MSHSTDSTLGRKVGDVQLGESIGRGAFGRVYRGLNLKDGTVVAVKEIDKGMLTPDKLPSIKRESELLQKLDHPHIVKFVSCFETDEFLYFILEYIESGSLYSTGKKFGFFSEELLKIYIFQLLSGLEYLHAQGVIHRDIKGANLLLTKQGVVKLADFGSCTYEAINKQYTVVGTPFWMAPEIIEMSGGGKVSDIWSVGCTVIELLTGKPPYWDLGATCALYKMVQNERPPLPKDISKELKSFLCACFTRDLDERPSACELQKHEWLNGVESKKATSMLSPSDVSKTLRLEKQQKQKREILKLKEAVARLTEERDALASKLSSVEQERDELKAELSLQRMGHLPTSSLSHSVLSSSSEPSAKSSSSLVGKVATSAPTLAMSDDVGKKHKSSSKHYKSSKDKSNVRGKDAEPSRKTKHKSSSSKSKESKSRTHAKESKSKTHPKEFIGRNHPKKESLSKSNKSNKESLSKSNKSNKDSKTRPSGDRETRWREPRDKRTRTSSGDASDALPSRTVAGHVDGPASSDEGQHVQEEEMFCAKCAKAITAETKGRAAMNAFYHPECFTCSYCHAVLDKYVVNEGKPYCPSDYNRLFAHRCGGCGEIIRGAFINALGQYWHAEHFNCIRCKMVITSTFVPRNGHPLCKECLEVERRG